MVYEYICILYFEVECVAFENLLNLSFCTLVGLIRGANDCDVDYIDNVYYNYYDASSEVMILI